MLFSVFFVLGSLSGAFSRPQSLQSLFELAFQEVPKKVEPQDLLGATPADTFPLVLTPLNFAPAVVAPPAFLYPSTIRFPPSGTKSSIRGAIPLFAPLKQFPYIRYYPVRTTFYLSEPNLRDPAPQVGMVPFPTKLAAPPPAFSPIRDTQISRRPQKPELQHNRESERDESHHEEQKGHHVVRVVQFPTDLMTNEDPIPFPTKLAAPQPSFSPIRDAQVVRKPEKVHPPKTKMPSHQKVVRVDSLPTGFGIDEDPIPFPTKLAAPRPSFSPIRDAQVSRIPEKISAQKTKIQNVKSEQPPLVRIVNFPSQIGPGPFETRDNPEIVLSAPGGIVQSGQPHFTYEPFSNAKLSQNLLSQNEIDVRMENEEQGNLPSIIEV